MYKFFTFMAFVPAFFGVGAFVMMDCKLNSLLYFTVCCASIGTNELVKNIYHQPRPYMTTNEIKAYHIFGYFVGLLAILILGNLQDTLRTH
jgi:hypothetical protein